MSELRATKLPRPLSSPLLVGALQKEDDQKKTDFPLLMDKPPSPPLSARSEITPEEMAKKQKHLAELMDKQLKKSPSSSYSSGDTPVTVRFHDTILPAWAKPKSARQESDKPTTDAKPDQKIDQNNRWAQRAGSGYKFYTDISSIEAEIDLKEREKRRLTVEPNASILQDIEDSEKVNNQEASKWIQQAKATFHLPKTESDQKTTETTDQQKAVPDEEKNLNTKEKEQSVKEETIQEEKTVEKAIELPKPTTDEQPKEEIKKPDQQTEELDKPKQSEESTEQDSKTNEQPLQPDPDQAQAIVKFDQVKEIEDDDDVVYTSDASNEDSTELAEAADKQIIYFDAENVEETQQSEFRVSMQTPRTLDEAEKTSENEEKKETSNEKNESEEKDVVMKDEKQDDAVPTQGEEENQHEKRYLNTLLSFNIFLVLLISMNP